MASKLVAWVFLAFALVLAGGCDPEGPLAPVRNLVAPTPGEPTPATLVVQTTITGAGTSPATLAIPVDRRNPVGEPTRFQVTTRSTINARGNNVTNLRVTATLTTTTGVTLTAQPVSIEWVIVDNPPTVNFTFTGEAPLDNQNQITGQVTVTVTGTDMGTGNPVTSSTTTPFTITATPPPPPPPSCQQTSTSGCAFNRFLITYTGRDGQGNTRNGPVLQQFFDGVRFDVFNDPLLVQIVDRCQNNNRFWVFASSATDVEVELNVTDTQSGQVKTYRNPLGTPFQPIQDTNAFATCP